MYRQARKALATVPVKSRITLITSPSETPPVAIRKVKKNPDITSQVSAPQDAARFATTHAIIDRKLGVLLVSRQAELLHALSEVATLNSQIHLYTVHETTGTS